MKKKPFQRLEKLWNYLKGSQQEIPMQVRIFHSGCILTIVAVIYLIPFSIANHFTAFAVACGILLPLLFLLYYLSRFKNKRIFPIIIYILLFNLLFAYMYLQYGGIRSSILLSFSSVYFLTLATSPQKHYVPWTIFNLTLVLSLVSWEYYHPHLFNEPFSTRQELIFDFTSTYILSVIFIWAGVSFIISNYSKEKSIAEDKNIAWAELNNQKNQLLSILSHDLKAPLISIKQYLTILSRRDLSETSRIAMKAELTSITANTQTLLNNILQWVKANLNNLDTSLHPTNVYQAIKGSISIYKDIAKMKGIELSCLIDDQSSINSNSGLLDIIIRNLINNAINNTAEGGKITLYERINTDSYSIICEDNGNGIPAELQQILFTEKHQYHNQFGVGLLICKEFIKIIQGEISFTTRIGKGTSFILHFKQNVKQIAAQ